MPGVGRNAGRVLAVHIDRVPDWRCNGRRGEV